MSIPSFSAFPPVPQRSAPEADFDAKMYALFQHFAVAHRDEMLAFIDFLENNSTAIGAALNATTIGLNTPAAGKFTALGADSLSVGGTKVAKWGEFQAGQLGGLMNGSDFGTVIEAPSQGHVVVALRENNDGDSFSVVSGGGDYSTDSTYDTTVLYAAAGGRVGIGTSTPVCRAHVREDAAATAAAIWAGNASFASTALQLNAFRGASSVYKFLEGYSGNLTDKEFQISGDGNGTIDGSWTGGGADYAEWFEWADGNLASEDRRGLSVVLDGDKIRPALAGEQPIGVISANPSVVGDGDIDRWKGKYLRDEFGAYLWEDYEALSWTETMTETVTVQERATDAQERTREVIEVVDGRAVRRTVSETIQVPLFDELPLVDEAGNDLGTHRLPRIVDVEQEFTREVQHSYAADEVPEGVTVPADAERVTQKRRTLNPAYDPSFEYTPRAERPEWDMVGLMGKLRLRTGQPVADTWIKMRDVSETVEEWLVR